MIIKKCRFGSTQTIFVLFLDTFHSRMNETFYLETGSLRKIMHPIRDFLSRHEG